MAVTFPALLVKLVGRNPDSLFRIAEASIQLAEERLPFLKPQERREVPATMAITWSLRFLKKMGKPRRTSKSSITNGENYQTFSAAWGCHRLVKPRRPSKICQADLNFRCPARQQSHHPQLKIRLRQGSTGSAITCCTAHRVRSRLVSLSKAESDY